MYIFFSVNCGHSCFNKIFIVLNLCTSFFKWCLILLLNWPILLWFYPFLHILASLLFREDLSLFFRINLILYSCSFCLSEEFFVSHSILSDNLNGESILGCKFSPFRTLNIYCKNIYSGWQIFCREINLWGFPCDWLFVFLFLTFEYSLTFVILIMICFGMGLLGSSCSGSSPLSVAVYLFPSLGLESVQP